MTYEQDWTQFYQLAEMIARVCFVQRKDREQWEEQVEFLFEMLEEFEFEDVKNAMRQHVKTQKFFPTPADITRLIAGSAEERSILAWRCFLQSLDRYGYYDSVRFPDSAYHYVVQRLGGWERLSHEWRDLTEKELQFRRPQWRELYEIGLRVASWGGETGKVSVPKYLCGFYERDNREGGHLDFIPDVIEVETGNRIDRHALDGPAPDNIIALPVFGNGTEAL